MTETEATLPVASQSYSQRLFGPRAALFAGFGTLLALMAIMSFDSLRILGTTETSDAQIRRDFLYRERTLEQVRSGLYESDNIVRDYILVESNRNAQEMLRRELQSIRDETNAALQSCIQTLPRGAKEPFQKLAVELEGYWSTLDPIFEWDKKEKQRRGYSFLRSDVLSQHTTVLAIAKEVSAINEDELKQGERKIAEVFAQFRRRLQTVSAIAISLGLILAGATVIYTARLEKRAEDRYHESLQAHRELKELSKRLVDAQEQERRAISRELHDEIGQSLSALLMDVEHLSAIPGKDGAYRQALENIKTLAENSVNEVRNMSLLLRPSMLDDLGLVAALEWQAREISKRSGMRIKVDAEQVSEQLPE